tara:strand:- start:60 stop:2396 length:2337 start_codon:yes stop_codon:yes gene_type:complete
MRRSRSEITSLTTTQRTVQLSPIERLKHLGSPKRKEIYGVKLGPGRNIPKGKKHLDIIERESGAQRAFGQRDPAHDIAVAKAKAERERLAAIPKTLQKYNRNELYPEWMRKDERFDRIFKMPMLPEFVAIRKKPANRHDEDKNALTKWLGTHSLFTHFSQLKRRALGNITRLQKFQKGEVICSHGVSRHKFFIVINASVQISSPALGPLGVLNVGDSVGHVESHAIMEKFAETRKKEYDIVLKALAKDTHVAVILRSEYREAMAEFEDLEMWENIRFMQKDVSLFRDWSKSRLMIMAKSLETWNVEKGEIVVEQLRPSDYMFFVVEGQCAVQKRIHFTRDNNIPTKQRGVFDVVTSVTNMDVEIHIVKRGDYFGHHSFLTNETIAQRKQEIEEAKTRSKGANTMRNKVGGGLGKLFAASSGGSSAAHGMLSGLGASVAALQVVEQEKKVAKTLPRSATVVARTHCKLLALSLDNFWSMMTYGDTIDQLMEHIRHFKTQDEVIRGFDEHKRRRKIWENAKTALQETGHSLGGMMDFEDAVPRPMKITVAGESFRHIGAIMGGHFDVPAAIMRRRRKKFKLKAKLKKAAKLGSFMAKFQRRSSISDLRPGSGGGSSGGLASLFGGGKKGGSAASLFGVFGDAMSANALSKLKKGSENKPGSRGKSRSKKSAKDKRYNKKQQEKRHKLANASPETSKSKKPHKFGKLAQHSSEHQRKQGKGINLNVGLHGPHGPHGPHSHKQLDTRKKIAGDDEWEHMMEEEMQKGGAGINKGKKKKKKKH